MDNDNFNWTQITCSLSDYSPGAIVRCENLYLLLYRSRVDAVNVLSLWNPHYVEFCKEHPEASGFTAAASATADSANLAAAAVINATGTAAATAARLAAARLAAATAAIAAATAAIAAEATFATSFSTSGPGAPQPPIMGKIIPTAAYDEVSAETFLDLLSQEEDLKPGNEVKWVEKFESMTVIGACFDGETCLPLIKVLVCAGLNGESGPIVGWVCLHPAMGMQRAVL